MTRAEYAKRNAGSFFRRHATVIPAIIIALCVMGVFVLQAMTIGQLQSTVERQNTLILQTASLSKQLVKGAAQRTSQINDVNRHLDCIVQFFAQSDRSSKAIADIDSCRISTQSTSEQQQAKPIQPAPSKAESSSPTPATSGTKSSTSSQPTNQPAPSTGGGLIGGVENIVQGVTSGLSKLFGGK